MELQGIYFSIQKMTCINCKEEVHLAINCKTQDDNDKNLSTQTQNLSQSPITTGNTDGNTHNVSKENAVN